MNWPRGVNSFSRHDSLKDRREMQNTDSKENWKMHDLTEWILDLMIGYYSELIFNEQNRKLPDLEKIQA